MAGKQETAVKEDVAAPETLLEMQNAEKDREIAELRARLEAAQADPEDAIPREASDRVMDSEAQGWGPVYGAESKVRIKIPKDPLNKHDEVVPVCLNGYNFFIKRGVTVDVPKTVADVLTEAEYI